MVPVRSTSTLQPWSLGWCERPASYQLGACGWWFEDHDAGLTNGTRQKNVLAMETLKYDGKNTEQQMVDDLEGAPIFQTIFLIL
eukprot:scaffold10368_cov180-Amphora_coffeaeformis.AAC.5